MNQDIQNQIKKIIEDNKVVLFMKGTPEMPMCGFSADGFSADKRMTPSTMILKCQFSPQLRRAGLRTHFKRMVQAVRTHIGEDFLRNERLIIAHPIRDNSFLREYKLNFVESTRKSTTRRTS